MKRIKEYLNNNPREKDAVELELLKAGIEFYHIVSLLWDKTTRKYTKEFLIWKTRELLEIIINNLDDTEELENRIKEATALISEASAEDKYSVLYALGAEIDNSPYSQYGFTIDFKIAALLFLLQEKEQITLDQILEKY